MFRLVPRVARVANRVQRTPFFQPKRSVVDIKPQQEYVLQSYSEAETSEQAQPVLFSFGYFYLKTAITAIIGGITLYSIKNFFWKNELDDCIAPNAREEMMQCSVDMAFTLYTKYKARGLIYDPETFNSYGTIKSILDEVLEAAYKIGATKHLQDIDWRIHIIDEDSGGFYMLPSGDIFIHRGLLLILDDPKKFYYIFAHEIGHLHLQHWETRYTQYSTRWPVTSLFSIFPFGGMRPNGLFNYLLYAKYSLIHEIAADSFAYVFFFPFTNMIIL